MVQVSGAVYVTGRRFNLRGNALAQRPPFHSRLMLHVLNLLRQRVLIHVGCAGNSGRTLLLLLLLLNASLDVT